MKWHGKSMANLFEHSGKLGINGLVELQILQWVLADGRAIATVSVKIDLLGPLRRCSPAPHVLLV